MRLRSSVRSRSQPTECTKDVHVRSRPRVKSDICKEKTGGILKTNTSNSKDSIPLTSKNELIKKCHTKGKLDSKILPSQDPYLFMDDDDDDKENIDPNSRKQTTKKRVARAKVAHSVKPRPRKLLSPTRPTGRVNQIMRQEMKQLYSPEPKKLSCVMNPQVALTLIDLNRRNNLESSSANSNSTPNVESKSLPSNITDKVVVGGAVSVPDTPEHQNNVSVRTPEVSVPVILKQALDNLKPHISSTPATSSGTVISHPEFVVTPINCPVNSKNIATNDNNSNQITDNQSQSQPISTSDTYTNTSEDNSSSKDRSKESTSSSGQRRKRESKSDREKAYNSWLDEFNAELQKYESFELSIEKDTTTSTKANH
ncbi:unnamed protein product [Trichobilharzia szidati]|nr:unnamed protein product [Trichobilharzia szidati]